MWPFSKKTKPVVPESPPARELTIELRDRRHNHLIYIVGNTNDCNEAEVAAKMKAAMFDGETELMSSEFLGLGSCMVVMRKVPATTSPRVSASLN